MDKKRKSVESGETARDEETFEQPVFDVFQAWRHRVCRLAVLFPLLGEKVTSDGASLDLNNAAITEAFRKLRVMWTARVGELHTENWSLAESDVTRGFMCTCPAFSVFVAQRRRPCGRQRICPFCYARECVRKPYAYLEEWLYGDNPDPKKRIHPQYQIVETLRQTTFSPFSRHLELAEVSKCWGNLKKTLLTKERRFELDILKPLVGFVFHRVSANAIGITFSRSGVFVVDSKQPNKQIEKRSKSVKVTLHRPITKRNLAVAVASATTYPRELMFGSAAHTAALLAAMKNTRMLSTFWRRGLKKGFGVEP